jgi:ectoine hydroxylase-related dioxygenase (phytanoyl-CoA dioxygenase family)
VNQVRRKQNVYGIRNLLEVCPAVARLAAAPQIRRFVTPLLGDHAFAVRAIFFDKVQDANWSLSWHQDTFISVANRLDAPQFTGGSRKAGVWQVRPPFEVLANMAAVRIHLDDCGADNGPLRVLPGSHRQGLIEAVDEWKRRVGEVVCTVRGGGVVIMHPLLLHASSAAAAAGHRRVIHIEYACDELPFGLTWNTRIAGSR